MAGENTGRSWVFIRATQRWPQRREMSGLAFASINVCILE